MPLIERGLNPFTPENPVSKEHFVGRKFEINRILRSAHQVSLGKGEWVFADHLTFWYFQIEAAKSLKNRKRR